MTPVAIMEWAGAVFVVCIALVASLGVLYLITTAINEWRNK